MSFALKLNLSIPRIRPNSTSAVNAVTPHRLPYRLSLPARRPNTVSVHSQYVNGASEPSISSHYTETIGTPSPPSQLLPWNLTQRHVVVLNVVACTTAVSATWLFCSAIPTLLAFKRAADSLAKLMDVMREELPDTMAAVRLSGMEISDLTMELSDIGQEITQGVRSSTRAVRVAEERLRGLTNVAPSASVQVVERPKTEVPGPALARTARSIREGVVKSRAVWQMFFTITKFSRLAFNYLIRWKKR